MRRFLIAAAIALGAAATPAAASEAFTGQNFTGAAGLDRLETTYVRHNREHRMYEIQRNMERQQRRGYRGDGYGRRGYGPPPHARGYGRGYDRGYGPRY